MKFRIVSLAIVMSFGMLIPVATHVQVQAQDDPAPTVTREVAEDDADEAGLDDEEGADDGGTFLPTEKINVDSSVSFPVDI